MNANRKKILAGCIAASLLLHAALIGFLQSHSLWLSSSQTASTQKKAPWLSSIEKKAKDQILKEAFDAASTEGAVALSPQKERIQAEAFKPHFSLEAPSFENPSYPLFQNAFPQIERSVFIPHIPTFSFFPQAPLDLFQHLPKDLILPEPISARHSLFPSPPTPHTSDASLQPSSPPTLPEPPEASITYPPSLLQSSDVADGPPLLKKTLPTPLPTLPILPSLAELQTTSYSDTFDADLVFLPCEEGYLFALTLIPRTDLDLPKLKQQFLFLLDRANSVQQERLQAAKAAILKSLEELSPDDSFNIIAFDSKMEKLSPRPLPVQAASLDQAEQFLEKISLGSFFSPADPYQPLMLTVPSQVPDDELYTAILLTDGESFAKKATQKAVLQNWTAYNGGKVSLFPVLLDTDAQLPLLDTAAIFNKGKVHTANSRKGMKRKLLKLMRNLQHPIAKNMHCKAISRSEGKQITLLPNPSLTPHLYLNEPFVLLGKTNNLDDFVLFVQGRAKDRWIHIKKTISFVNARKGTSSLKAEWALQTVYPLYEKYLQEQDASSLKEAALLLEPYDLQVAFR